MVLIVAPVKLIWRIRLPLATKIRLISIFASTLVTTAVSLYYIWALFKIGGLTEEWAATIHVRPSVREYLSSLSDDPRLEWRELVGGQPDSCCQLLLQIHRRPHQ